MKVPPSIWIGYLTAGVLLGALLVFAAETHQAPVIDSKEVARRVADRNIFDPERQPRIRGESRPTPKPKVVAEAPGWAAQRWGVRGRIQNHPSQQAVPRPTCSSLARLP